MRRDAAAAGSSVFLALAPGTMGVAVPWAISRWRFESPLEHWLPVRIVGAGLALLAGAVIVHAFARFVVDGLGTPAPIAPTEHLVVTGIYRYVRNPMYLAVTAAIVGQALLFGQLWLLAYAAAFLALTASFVHWYEEPTLTEQFAADYPAYRDAVPGWLPRLTPWRNGQPSRR
jgi:protein-S-isoprenylcysteine O-methyltransferase Ste14